MGNRWLLMKEIVEYVGVLCEPIYKWTEDKEMSVHRIVRSLKSKNNEVDAWLKSGKTGEEGFIP